MSQNSPKQWFNLEELFFNELDQQLLAKLRDKESNHSTAEAIMKVTGITDVALAEELAGIGINPETLTAFRLVPMIAVAWADDRVTEEERFEIAVAAEKSGLKPDHPGMELLKAWLVKRPHEELLKAWCDYAKALAASMNGGMRALLKKEVVAQIHNVAAASGGVFGFGAESPSERAVMKRIEDALQ